MVEKVPPIGLLPMGGNFYGSKCQDPAGSWGLDVSVGAVDTRICTLQGSVWVQWVKRQGFCGRDEKNKMQEDARECRIDKDSGDVGWVHKSDSRFGDARD